MFSKGLIENLRAPFGNKFKSPLSSIQRRLDSEHMGQMSDLIAMIKLQEDKRSKAQTVLKTSQDANNHLDDDDRSEASSRTSIKLPDTLNHESKTDMLLDLKVKLNKGLMNSDASTLKVSNQTPQKYREVAVSEELRSYRKYRDSKRKS